MYNHKGQINPAVVIGVVSVVITLIALGIVLAASQKSLSIIRTTITENKASNLAKNDTTASDSSGGAGITYSGANTTIYLSQNNLAGDPVVYNNGTIVNKGKNWTIDQLIGNWSFTNVSNDTGPGTPEWVSGKINISYPYFIGSVERNITKQGQEGVKVFQDFQPTFATVFAAFIVITLVIGLTAVFWNKMGN